jgi:hypothetical protein
LTPAETTYALERNGPTYRMEWTAPYSPKLLVDTVVSYQDFDYHIGPSEAGINNSCVVSNSAIFEQAQCINLENGQTSGSFPLNWDDQTQRLTLRTQAQIFGGRFWGSSHQFKVGFVVENERYYLDQERRPEISFQVVNIDPNEGGAGGDIEPRGAVSMRVSIPPFSSSKATATNWAIYADDQIKPLSNLTVTVGFRVDNEQINSNGYQPMDIDGETSAFVNGLASNPPNINEFLDRAFTAYEGVQDFVDELATLLGDQGVQNPYGKIGGGTAESLAWEKRRRRENVDITNTNLSPYLAVAWDPFKTGKTKFSASAGRHYDKIFLAIPLVELEPATTDLNFQATFNGVQGNWEIGSLCEGGGACLNPAANITTVDRDLSTPYQDEFSFAVERELAAETSISFRYLQRNFEDQLQDKDLNHIPGDYGRCQLQEVANIPPLVASPGVGTRTDPFGEEYYDNDPGDGDGRLDDCIGRFVTDPEAQGQEPPVGGVPAFAGTLNRPDGFPDAYIQNPGWGEYFLIGNFNTTEYKAFTVELNRRQYRNWQMNASYTWSEAVGDAEDFRQVLGNDRTIINDEYGYLSYDQRHVVKINATTIIPWAGGFRLGTAIQWQSGLPYSILERSFALDTVPLTYVGLGNPTARSRLRYITGQRNDHRNESWWNFDVHVAKEFNLSGGVNLQVNADILNLFNEDHLQIFNQINGYNAYRREFGRQFQIGLRVAF